MPYVMQDFCDRCYLVVCKAVFDKENGSLTCGQLKEKIRKEFGRWRKFNEPDVEA